MKQFTGRANMKLYNQDCMPALEEMGENEFDLCICDPPYGINYTKIIEGNKKENGWKEREKKEWDKNAPSKTYFNLLMQKTKNQIIWGGNHFNLLPTRCYLIWDKVQRINQADCEFAWTSFDKPARIFQYSRGNESGFAPKSLPTDKKFVNIHPTQKPVALYKWLLKNYANEGDTILDTHLGSMSIAIACWDMGYDLVGYEIDEDYFKKGVERVRKHTNQMQLF